MQPNAIWRAEFTVSLEYWAGDSFPPAVEHERGNDDRLNRQPCSLLVVGRASDAGEVGLVVEALVARGVADAVGDARGVAVRRISVGVAPGTRAVVGVWVAVAVAVWVAVGVGVGGISDGVSVRNGSSTSGGSLAGRSATGERGGLPDMATVVAQPARTNAARPSAPVQARAQDAVIPVVWRR